MLPYLWVNLPDYLSSQHMEVKTIRGDGFCFLSAVAKVLEFDHKMTIPVQKAMEKIMKFLCENFEKYTAYHQQKAELPAGDTLISDVIEFFSSCNYNTNIVNLLMQITTDCLDLDLNIFQNNSGQIQVYNFTSTNAYYTVNLKFSHNAKHPQGNHYDAITQIPPVKKKPILSNVSDFYGWEKIKKEKSATIGSSTTVIDLTDEDDGLTFPDQVPLQRTNSAADSLYEGTTDNYSISNETYMSSEAECPGTGQYCTRNTPRSTTTAPPSTPSTDAHSDTTYSSTQAHSDEIFSSIQGNSDSNSDTTYSSTQPSFLSQATFPTFLTGYLDEGDTRDSDLDSILSKECDEDTESPLQSVSRGRPFPTWFFNTIIPKYLKKIPDDIDGTQLYKVPIREHLWHVPTSDKRHFRMLTSSREGFTGERRIGTCKGSFVCNNKACPFIRTSQFQQPNKVSWHNIRGNLNFKVCAICDHVAQRIYCGAKKLVEYDYAARIATVYHLGTHKCWPKISTRTSPRLEDPRVIWEQVMGSAKEVGLRQIVRLIDEGDMEAAEKEAEVWIDRRKVRRQMESLNPQQGMDHNSFDAVGIVKAKTDTKDPFYIYKIGNKNLSGGSDFVFKSSRRTAKIALDMDVDGEANILQMENAYFDATHTRVYGFKSLGLWLIHPAMKKILRLASMEIRSENHQDITLFFRLFNEILSTVKEEPNYKFNPRYFVCDEAGANYKAITQVYGPEFSAIRVKGCQWHFKSDVKNHVSKLRPEDQETFLTTCNALCDITTVADYNRLKVVLDDLAEKNPEIKPFILY